MLSSHHCLWLKPGSPHEGDWRLYNIFIFDVRHVGITVLLKAERRQEEGYILPAVEMGMSRKIGIGRWEIKSDGIHERELAVRIRVVETASVAAPGEA